MEKMAKQKWNLNYSLLGDENHEISNDFPLYKEDTPEAFASFTNEKNFVQPGVYVIDKKSTPLYSWTSMPSVSNVVGVTGRPKPRHVMEVIRSSFETG
mmetsp:Transcript_17777/g.19809  ORF Transcript_17777/g.19809 Transcript_17777/m.19809 type:complete len:98 (-) Transcript_17777:12-305(-)